MFSLRHVHIATRMPIASLFVYLRPPPLEPLHQSWIHESKKDNHQPNRKSAVQRRRQSHGVFGPPGACSALDLVVEYVAYQRPDREIQSRSRRNPRQRAEEDRKVDLANERVAFVARVEVQRDRRYGAEQETPYQWSIRPVYTEELGWADNAPENGAVKVDACQRTTKAIYSFWGTNPRHISEHPIQHANLRQRRHEGGCHLHAKENAWRDLHIVSELKIGREFDALCGGDVAVCHEDHVGDWTAREEGAASELTDEVDGGLLVCDCGYDADWDEQDGTNA